MGGTKKGKGGREWGKISSTGGNVLFGEKTWKLKYAEKWGCTLTIKGGLPAING